MNKMMAKLHRIKTIVLLTTLTAALPFPVQGKDSLGTVFCRNSGVTCTRITPMPDRFLLVPNKIAIRNHENQGKRCVDLLLKNKEQYQEQKNSLFYFIPMDQISPMALPSKKQKAMTESAYIATFGHCIIYPVIWDSQDDEVTSFDGYIEFYKEQGFSEVELAAHLDIKLLREKLYQAGPFYNQSLKEKVGEYVTRFAPQQIPMRIRTFKSIFLELKTM